jgi:hypothetical protein
MVWPEALAMGRQWCGVEEHCTHGYCGRSEFDNLEPEGTMEALEAIPGILAASRAGCQA